MTPTFLNVPRFPVLGLPILSWVAIAIVIGAWFVLTRLPFGRAAYASGGNPTAAVYAGIDIGWTRFIAFVISGALAGLAGYLWVSRYAVAYVDVASGFELDTVAACVIGGISIAGGIGSVAGAVLGALFLGVIKNALPVIGISPFAQMAISGVVIVLAVLFTPAPKRRPAASSCEIAQLRRSPHERYHRPFQPNIGNARETRDPGQARHAFLAHSLQLGSAAFRRRGADLHLQLLRLALFPQCL